MQDHTRVRSALIPLAVACALFIVVILLDQRTVAAVRAEDSGAARAPIVDSSGTPLAWSNVSDGKVRLRYASPGLTSVLGFADPAGTWHGLEERYEAQLSGQAERSNWKSFWEHLAGDTISGDTLASTISLPVQRAAEKGLGDHMGAVVALDPRTGAVLAMASKPFCSPTQLAAERTYRKCQTDRRSPLVNRAIQHRFAPGSAFKVVTLSAAIASGTFHLDDTFSGAEAFGPSPYFDNSTYPSNVTRSDLTVITLAQALAFSDNFTFAHVGLTLGSDLWLKYAHAFMVDRPIPFELPVRTSQVDGGAASLTPGELARASFGAPDDSITPFQMALIAAAVANGGTMMAPHLTREILSPSGHPVWRYQQHVLSKVMSPAAARQVTDGMVFVVTDGSGFNAAIPGMAVAGKTGTAASSGDRANAWFISFAPAYHPRVAVAVLVQYSGEGFEYAAPVARAVMQAALHP